MPVSNLNLKADWYFQKQNDKWQSAKILLRKIALDSGLKEDLTYGKPTYYCEAGKVFLIHTFKDYAALLFFKGSLMLDPNNILVQQTPNVQASRQLRFVSVGQIKEMEDIIQKYINEAINVESSGRQIEFKKTHEFQFVEELQTKMDKDPKLADAFYALTPGRQRGYLLYFSSAKQSKTREQRVAASIPYILKGKGRLKGNGFEE
jgi:uncharacterized protein YdeI (YjbR/CyaY-like superfamily)